MDVIVERPAALDVHKAQVTACVRLPGEGRERRSEVREFSTMVGGLLVLRDWLEALGVTSGGDGGHRCLLEMRREAPCCIPGAAGRNSKEGSWVQWLTRI